MTKLPDQVRLPDSLGKFAIIRKLGHGAMGTVFLAYDSDSEREVALKVLSDAESGEEAESLFTKEGRAISRLAHPNVVAVYEAGRLPDARLFISMERLKGQDLGRVLAGRGLALAETVDLAHQILDALAHAHSKGVVHRDVKPANVFLCDDGRVKVVDFGISRLLDSISKHPKVVGTPAYMSPEQVRADPGADERSDLFSVGALIFEMTTGRRAFAANNIMALFYKITHEEPPFELVANETLRSVLRRAMAKDPNDRFASAIEFRSALSLVAGITECGESRTDDPRFLAERSSLNADQPAIAPRTAGDAEDSSESPLLSNTDHNLRTRSSTTVQAGLPFPGATNWWRARLTALRLALTGGLALLPIVAFFYPYLQARMVPNVVVQRDAYVKPGFDVRVTDRVGALPGAAIRLSTQATRIRESVADARGRALFLGLSAGAFELEVGLRGFHSTTVAADLDGSPGTKLVRIVLTPSKLPPSSEPGTKERITAASRVVSSLIAGTAAKEVLDVSGTEVASWLPTAALTRLRRIGRLSWRGQVVASRVFLPRTYGDEEWELDDDGDKRLAIDVRDLVAPHKQPEVYVEVAALSACAGREEDDWIRRGFEDIDPVRDSIIEAGVAPDRVMSFSYGDRLVVGGSGCRIVVTILR